MSLLTDAIAALSPTHYWKLDETSGSTAADSGSGTTRNMTHINSPFLGVDGPTSSDVGVAYNGVDQLTRLILGASGTGDIGTSNTGTFLFFVRMVSSSQRSVSFAASGSNGFTWDWFQDGSDFPLSSATLDSGGASRSVETADINAVAPGNWTMLAFVHSGTVMTGWGDDGFIPAGNWALSGAGSPDGSAWIDFSGFATSVNRFAFGALDRLSPIFGDVRMSNVAYFDGTALSESQLQDIFDIFEAGSTPVNPPTPPVVLNAWQSTISALGVHHLWKLDETSGDALDTGATAGLDLEETTGSGNRWRLAPGPIRGQPREYALWGSLSLGGGLQRTASGLASAGFNTGAVGGVIHVWSTNVKVSYIFRQIYNNNSSAILELTVETDGSFQMRAGLVGINILTARTATGLAIDGTSYVVVGVQRADGTGLRIFVDGVDVTVSNVAQGTATLDSFPNDVLTGLSPTSLMIGAAIATGTASGGILISNPFVFVNSAPSDTQILALAESAIIDATDLSDYFETVFFLGGLNFLFWVPGWTMNANNDVMQIGNNIIETNIFAGGLASPSSRNNLESGGSGKQIISQFNNYYSIFSTNNQAFQSAETNTSTIGTFNFIGRISNVNPSGFNVILGYATGASPGDNTTTAFFYLEGSVLGYKWGFRMQLVGGDFFQALAGSFTVPEPDEIKMFTVVQDGTGVLFYVDGELISTDDTSSGTTYDENDWLSVVDANTGSTVTNIGSGVGGGASNFDPNEVHDIFMLDSALSAADITTLWNAVNGVFPAVSGGAFHTLLLTTGNDGTGPDHYWRMNDVTSVLADSGIRPSRSVDPITGATIQQLGNPVQGQTSPIPDDSTAASILFDGTLDAYEVGVNGVSGSLIDNSDPSQTGSIGFFFLPTSLQDSNIVYSQGDTSYGSFLQVGFNQDKLEVIIQRGANNKVTVTSGNSVSSTVFNFVVITCDGSEYRLYLNGRQDPETTTFVQGTANKGDWFRAIITTLSALSAKGTTGFTTETTGNVSEVFIYDPDVLTPEEIVDLFDAAVIDGFTGETFTEFHRTGVTSASHTMVVFDSEEDQ